MSSMEAETRLAHTAMSLSRWRSGFHFTCGFIQLFGSVYKPIMYVLIYTTRVLRETHDRRSINQSMKYDLYVTRHV